ncbi:MAG: hypothetical protein IJH50_00610 [Kiritimatiellae bacterium]|nr:hypothetical protein [Kiritimatiellia bacterium]
MIPSRHLICLSLVFGSAAALFGDAFDESILQMFASESCTFTGRLSAEFETAYLSSSGTLCDTRPTALQNLDWAVHLGDYGRLYGYDCFLSMLHDRQHELHRPAFNEFEGGVFYGYDWRLSENVTFFNGAGGVWNPLFGYRNGHDDTLWEFRYFQSLENPYVTPYWDTLTLIEPSQWTRLRFGVRRDFDLTETLTLSAWADGVWGCKRRFAARYGDEPYHQFLGGAFCTSIVGLQLSWRFAEGWCVYVKVRQFDTINQQARRAEKRKSAYYARRDIAIGTIGVAYEF